MLPVIRFFIRKKGSKLSATTFAKIQCLRYLNICGSIISESKFFSSTLT